MLERLPAVPAQFTATTRELRRIRPLRRGGGAATAASSSLPLCVRVENVTITGAWKSFYANPELLGVSFQVYIFFRESALTAALAAPAGAIRVAGKSAQVSVVARDAAVATAADPCPGVSNHLSRETYDHGSTLALSKTDGNTATQGPETREARDTMSSSAAGRRRARGLTAVATTLSSYTSSVAADLTARQPAKPFMWSLQRDDAFPSVRQNLLKALTRKDYLSAYGREVYVLAHLTLSDLSRMLSTKLPSSSSRSSRTQARTASGEVASTGVALDLEGASATGASQRHARSTTGMLAVSETDDANSCDILVASATSRIPPRGGPNLSTPMTTDGRAPHPTVLVEAAQNAYHFTRSSECTNTTCIAGAVCITVMIVLLACALLAYVHQLWRRRREKRADKRRLLRHELR